MAAKMLAHCEQKVYCQKEIIDDLGECIGKMQSLTEIALNHNFANHKQSIINNFWRTLDGLLVEADILCNEMQ